ncbi:hypothetical protein [Chlorogloea sp. CCALA 695]|uniref:hypothetical protein n=1 Tax=Chlorogloea sp. CCALA 695 TaxID=2107693 RepID=UPI000D0491C8|nr:hypothetical protein [Chlorogloea sp. CCALA 695]PSB32857.1 hypothetical protein C7B70_08820 [Chlorogloea sp. CCALA 695]
MRRFITPPKNQTNTGQGIQYFGKAPGFSPRFGLPKNIWEGSPDEGGDSVATTVEIHAVMNNDYG